MNKTFLGLGLAAALLLVGAGCRTGGVSDDRVPSATKPYNTAPITAEIKKKATPVKRTTAGTTAAAVVPNPSAFASMPYAQAIAVYSDGARLQFINCHASPGSLSIKRGAKLMLDNRDSIKHQMTLGSKVYSIGAFGFLIVTVETAGQEAVTCDGGGVGMVNVQP